MVSSLKVKSKKSFSSSIFFESIFTIAIFCVMLLIISNPARFTSGTISGLKLFIFSVLPGLFPFMLLTKILTEIGLVFKVTRRCDKLSYALFNVPGVALYGFVMSIISGYPIGAKIIGDLKSKGLINPKQAKLMSVFCTTSGPIFVIGTVGTFMFKSITFGIILYLGHILASLILGIVCGQISKFKYKSKPKHNDVVEYIEEPKRSDNMITDCLVSTINSLFIVGAYITMFYLVSELFETLQIFEAISKILSPVLSLTNLKFEHIKGFLYGILEVTRGSSALSTIGDNSSKILASFILSFSGLSIIMQSMAFLKPAGISTAKFVLIKFAHASLTALLVFLFLL